MKKKLVPVFMILLLTALLAACSGDNSALEKLEFNGSCGNPAASDVTTSADEEEGYVKLSAEEAKAFIDEHSDAVILDVRRKSEYKDGHIPGATLLTNETISKETVADLTKNAPTLVYCRTGKRSQQAAQKLVDLGFTEVYDFGGIQDWPYEVE